MTASALGDILVGCIRSHTRLSVPALYRPYGPHQLLENGVLFCHLSPTGLAWVTAAPTNIQVLFGAGALAELAGIYRVPHWEQVRPSLGPRSGVVGLIRRHRLACRACV
jgi:hypothetical protein